MLEIAQPGLKSAAEVTRAAPLRQASNGIRYASFGDTELDGAELEQMVQAVPQRIAAALGRKVYYFVPLALAEPMETDLVENAAHDGNPDKLMIAAEFSTDLAENAICHRNAILSGIECVFISTRLMQDRFALAFELYINAGHHFVDAVGVPETFTSLLWSQAQAEVRGETSQDAWEFRARALGRPGAESSRDRWNAPQSRTRRKKSAQIEPAPVASTRIYAVDEKARTEYFDAAFADAIAIYLLSLTVDFDYTELREREYPLLAAPALAERLRHVAQLFPANAGQEFSIRYRRR